MISVIIPYIRKNGLDKCIDKLISGNKNFEYEIVAQEDKERIGCVTMVKNLTNITKYDLVMFLQDDSIPHDNILIEAYNKMQEFEDGWGLVCLNDQSGRGSYLPTHWLGHKKMLKHLDGEFFHTGYLHCYGDTELGERCLSLNRYKYADKAILMHNHPITTGKKELMDADYARIYSKEYMNHDYLLFHNRKKNGWKTT